MNGLRVMARQHPRLTAFVIGWLIIAPMVVLIKLLVQDFTAQLIMATGIGWLAGEVAIQFVHFLRDGFDDLD